LTSLEGNEFRENNIKIISSCVSNDKVESININNNIEGNEGNSKETSNKNNLIKFTICSLDTAVSLLAH
jgi:hypothetical protein